jgi:hypothetical protein
MKTARRRDVFAAALVSSVLTALVLGGGVAVALNVPNNSVNSAKVANNSIKSEDIKNNTILDADLNRETRTYFALIEFQAGVPSLVNGEGVHAIQDVGTGSVNVVWTPDITNCAIQASMQSIGIEDVPSRLIVTAERFNAAESRDGLFMQTVTPSNVLADPASDTGYAVTINC